jgi:hypothetical protein
MKCVHNGVIDNTSPDLCQGVVFLEPHDVITNSHQFDGELFSIVLTALLVAFITGHFAGRVVRWLGKL